jgi:hypothetical protein
MQIGDAAYIAASVAQIDGGLADEWAARQERRDGGEMEIVRS